MCEDSFARSAAWHLLPCCTLQIENRDRILRRFAHSNGDYNEIIAEIRSRDRLLYYPDLCFQLSRQADPLSENDLVFV